MRESQGKWIMSGISKDKGDKKKLIKSEEEDPKEGATGNVGKTKISQIS